MTGEAIPPVSPPTSKFYGKKGIHGIMEKMLVTKALNELKLLDSRIKREIGNSNFVTAAKTAETKVSPSTTKEEFSKNAKSDYQSILDLIERRANIKAAIVQSNAITEVVINEEKMTVATAIELKSSIEYEIRFLQIMKRQYENAKAESGRQNLLLEERIDKYLEVMMGKEGKTKKDDYPEMIDPIRQSGEYSLVDPLNIEEKITALENRIEGFQSEVDAVLQVSNCVTWIEI